MAYTVDFVPSAAKAFAKLPTRERQRLAAKIDALATQPRPTGAEKLTGIDAFRIRVGDYRVIYEIAGRALVVTVLAIGHRRDIYQRLKE